MMPPVLAEIMLIMLLILANGVFSLAETALLSMRRARLQHRANQGNARARAALELAEAPNRFLSTVQIGITLFGILAGALGSLTVQSTLAAWLASIEVIRPYSEGIALVIVVLTITYFSLVLGELLPKRLALSNPERMATLLAPLMQFLSNVARPFVFLLSLSTDLGLRVLGIRQSSEPPVTEDEIKVLLEQGTEAGVFQEVEQDMVESVLLLDDRRASALMTPRPEIVWLDINDPLEEIHRKITESFYVRFPVCDGSLDNILGEVDTRDLLARYLSCQQIDLRALLHKPLYVPETMPALKVLEAFKQSRTEMALVIDEYGSVQGLITLKDILEAIVGDIPSPDETAEPPAVRREDGSWLLDGMLPIDDFKELFDIAQMPGEDQGLYQTVGGFVILQLGHIPSPAEHFSWDRLRFEVVDMDGPRVDKVLVVPMPSTTAEDGEVMPDESV